MLDEDIVNILCVYLPLNLYFHLPGLCESRGDRPRLGLASQIITVIAVIYVVPYLADKGEHVTLRFTRSAVMYVYIETSKILRL